MCKSCGRIEQLTEKHQQVAETHSWQPVSYLGIKCTICSLGVCQVYILYNLYIHTTRLTWRWNVSRHHGLLNLEICVTHCLCTLFVQTPISKCTICTSHKLNWLDTGRRLLIAWWQHQGKLLISSVQFVHHANSLGFTLGFTLMPSQGGFKGCQRFSGNSSNMESTCSLSGFF